MEHSRMARSQGPPRILVIEDSAPLRMLIEATLDGAGYIVASVPDGAAGLDIVDSWRPDVILLDLNMPVLDGEAFARRYLAGPGPHAPLVVLSAALDAAVRAARIGAAACLGKPFSPRVLVATLSALIEARASIGTGCAAGATGEVPNCPSSDTLQG
jgi:CheY-like chemotaxis protein